MGKCTVGKHKNCQEMINGDLRIAVTTEVGPRIIGCFIGGDDDNMFVVLPNRPFKGVNTGFRIYGGHRLWHSPEAKPRSYQADNDPVQVTKIKDGFEFACPTPEAETGIRKIITVEALPNGVFAVNHILENCGQWDVELAPWALTMMAPGGQLVFPQHRDPNGYPYAPDRSLILWPYCSFTDPRLSLQDDYIFLKQDPKADSAIKIGYNNTDGWCAYLRNGKAFVKYFDYQEDSDYPDLGCSIESYSCGDFQEVETLGPLELLQPGECVEHTEYWQGIKGLPEIKNDKDVAKYLEPKLLLLEGECDDEECDCGCHNHKH